VAGSQAGRVAVFQFAHLGVGRTTIHDWVAAGYLRAALPRVYFRGMPVTTVADTLLGLAACTPDLLLVRRALARIEYTQGALDDASLRTACRRGRPGSARLNRALDGHDPRLAHTTARSRTAWSASASDANGTGSRFHRATSRSGV
jgi:hypothetical protein